MPLALRDTFYPYGMLNGMPMPTLRVKKESATTWVKGAVIIATSGYAVEAADGPTTGTILGVAHEAAVAGQLTALIVPALPEVVFSGKIATGDTGGDYTSLVTNRYLRYGVSLDSSGAWYINAADTTDLAVMVLDFIDAIGDNLAKVQFCFIDSKFNAI
jgi:hypothetical protein